MRQLGVAIVGCGDIAGTYAETLAGYPGVALRGAWDRNPPRVAALMERHGGTAYESFEDLLADPAVEAVVNLTRQTSHAELSTRALEAGKHVFSEKPVAMTAAQARALVELAQRRVLRLASAPITFLGEAQRTAAALVHEGRIGTVRVAYAECNWGRIERWHPRPLPFYEVGPVFDVGVYPLTIVTAMLGPAVSVRAHGKVLLTDRQTSAGEPFAPTAPDFAVAIVEFGSGALLRLTASFYTAMQSRQRGIELHGDEGMLVLDSWHRFDSSVEVASLGAELEPVELGGRPFAGVDYGRGVAELADAIATDRPHRGSGAHAAHVVEVMEAIGESMSSGAEVAIASTFEPPALEPQIAAGSTP